MYRKLVIFSICFSMIFCLGLTTISANGQLVNPQPLESKLIVIDAGHGGYDPGAVWGDFYEKDVNLKISKILQRLLEEKGAKVVLTRDGDYNYALKGQRGIEAKRYDLQKRIDIANEHNADILLTIHVNSTRERVVQGAEVFYHRTSQNGKSLALAIQQQFALITGMKKREAKISNCYMVRRSKMPAVLVEVGYLSNAEERERLQDPRYLTVLAEKIADGVVDYFNNNHQEQPGTPAVQN